MSPPDASPENAARRGPFFVVLNAGSGRHNSDEQQALIARTFEESGRAFEFLLIDDPARIREVARRAVELAVTHHGVVVAAGGDGTINAVAAVVLGSGCPFGVLPQGTFNYFGRVHGIPQETAAAARALLRASIEPVQAGQVNGRLFLVNASLGLYPQLLEDREAWKQQFGRSRFVALLSGIATLLQSPKQLHLQIESGGKTVALRTPTLFVGNNHLQLARVGINEEQADAVEQNQLAGIVVRPIGTLALFGLLMRGLLGQLGEAENIDSFSFRRLTVMPRGVKRIKVAADGEIAWMRPPLVFKIASQPLLLLVPAPDERVEVA